MRVLEVCVVSQNGTATRNYPTIDDALAELPRYTGRVSVETVVLDDDRTVHGIRVEYENGLPVALAGESAPLHTYHPERSSIPHAPTDR